MTNSSEESWTTATNPRHLLRLSRVQPNGGRKYLLLTCAAVRHMVPGPRTDLGERVLAALEQFAFRPPADSETTHLWREVVRAHAPEIPDPLPFDWSFGVDSAWARLFAHRLGVMTQVHTEEVKRVFDLGAASVRSAARQEAYQEAQALAARIALGSPAAPVGWFAQMLRQVNLPDAKSRLDGGRFREEIIARLPEAKRARVETEWPSGAGGFSPWQRGLTYLTADREELRSAESNLRACGLVREVFGNPFRPPGVDPAWLDWNHGAVPSIATQVAATGDFSALPILADALEEAGCQDEHLLTHCREPHLHIPGCWALDAVLGR
ncbi:hypothetical protein R5W24_003406 [Gemmata sp. JC717]|uniref:hypothetical protein n=1 Tax=Gemmata algarum TaxID=2975278 RepID=UPI0021BB867A|nr:hypothetical protein [Gemmata algarum]MDY3554287.1 hypothetical protein [Gemmata algarum]